MDQARLYEVAGNGTAWTDAGAAARQRRRPWLYGIGLAVNALTWTLAGLALLLGGPGWGAAFGLLAVLTTPLMTVPALIEAAARQRARRRHASRPSGFR